MRRDRGGLAFHEDVAHDAGRGAGAGLRFGGVEMEENKMKERMGETA